MCTSLAVFPRVTIGLSTCRWWYWHVVDPRLVRYGIVESRFPSLLIGATSNPTELNSLALQPGSATICASYTPQALSCQLSSFDKAHVEIVRRCSKIDSGKKS
jgi:hypothetical protein